MEQNSFNNLSKILERDDLTQEQKVEIITKTYTDYNKKLDHDLNMYLLKKWGGAALEIGSAAIPVGGAAKLGVKVGQKLLTKYAGRKLAGKIGAGTLSGLESGAVFGLGRGMMEDKNPIVTSVEDALSGAALGMGFGTVQGKILQDAHIREINELMDMRKDWGIAFQKASGNPEKAIETLLEHKKGFVPNAFDKEGIGKTNLVWGKDGEYGYGMAHFIEKRQKQNIDIDDFLKSLPETIEDGVVTQNDIRRPDNKYIEDVTNKIAIATDWNEKPRNWIVTAHRQNKSAAKRLMDSAPSSNLSPEKGRNSISRLAADEIISGNIENINPGQMAILAETLGNYDYNKSAAKRLTVSSPTSDLSPEKGSKSISRLAADEIISDNIENINPSHMAILSESMKNNQKETHRRSHRTTSTGSPVSPDNIITDIPDNINPDNHAFSKGSTYEKISPSMLKSGIEMNVNRNKNHIFTPQEIGKMSSEEFSRNENVIMEQLKNGQIKYDSPSIDYENYKNPETGAAKIFTREDISQMPFKEYAKYEKEIMAQHNSIGIPYQKDLLKKSRNSFRSRRPSFF